MRRCSARFRRTLSVAAAAASVALSTVRVHDLRRSALALFTSSYSCCSAVCRACACPGRKPLIRHTSKSSKRFNALLVPSSQTQRPLLRSEDPQSAFRSRAAALRARPPPLAGHACAWPAAQPRQKGGPEQARVSTRAGRTTHSAAYLCRDCSSKHRLKLLESNALVAVALLCCTHGLNFALGGFVELTLEEKQTRCVSGRRRRRVQAASAPETPPAAPAAPQPQTARPQNAACSLPPAFHAALP